MGEGQAQVELATFDNVKVVKGIGIPTAPEFTQIAKVSHPTTTYIDSPGIPSQTYDYALTAVDTSNNESELSNIATATVAYPVVDVTQPIISQPYPTHSSYIKNTTPEISVRLSDDISGINPDTIKNVSDYASNQAEPLTNSLLRKSGTWLEKKKYILKYIFIRNYLMKLNLRLDEKIIMVKF